MAPGAINTSSAIVGHTPLKGKMGISISLSRINNPSYSCQHLARQGLVRLYLYHHALDIPNDLI
jgi:hypothetical protein